MAMRRACRSPRLPSETSFSTNGRSSLALGWVVTICSCLIRLAAMLAKSAVRWLVVRPSLRCALPWRMAVSPMVCGASHDGPPKALDLVVELLGQLFDVLGRPVGHVHAEV